MQLPELPVTVATVDTCATYENIWAQLTDIDPAP